MNATLANLARRALANGIRALPLLSPRLDLPRKTYETTEAWYRDRGQRLPGVVFCPLDPPRVAVRPRARSIESETHWLLKLCETDNNWPTFVLTLPGGRLLRDDATILTPDGAILSDVSRHSGAARHPLFQVWRLPNPQFLSGTTAVLSVPAGGLYFHWMHDVLPRLDLLRRGGLAFDSIDRFVIPSAVGDFAWETLTHFGIDRSRVLMPRYESHYVAEKLVVPSLAGTSGNMLAASCDFLRREFLPTTSPPRGKRWYVSREDAAYRRVIGESEIRKQLARRGFEPIVLTGKTVREQAELFASAEAIVAAHGAGLSNLVFCSPGTRVVELFAPAYVNPCYYALAARLELSYFYLPGEGERPPENVDPHRIRDDITLSDERLERVLALAGL